ncbi:phage tail tape measure protein [Cellulosimicrobium terreum]|nr:phage tail tape measure protein [Cellulosimicrobium terreum]
MTVLDLGPLRASVELDDRAFTKKYGEVEKLAKNLDRLAPSVVVDANVTSADRKVGQVQDQLDRIAKSDTVTKVDAAIDAAEQNLERIRDDLDALEQMSPSPEVDADITKAKAALGAAQSALDGLRGERTVLEVDADTSSAEDAIGALPAEGDAAGEDAGGRLSGKIIAALATIPVAGAIVGIGAAIGEALMSGLQNEVREDRFAAQTGLDAATTARIGRAAGEAYANNFGESIAGNIDTARVAIQAGLLDPDATRRDAQNIIQSLTGVADVLEEDVGRTAQAVGVMLRTGVARDAQDAFDVLVRGAQSGANASEDLLDTFTEYPALFEKLGLDGATALGLINQGLEGGARNSDLVADALKEFQIRATDASEASAAGFEAIGLSAEDMTAKIAAGGEGAKEGLDQVLDGLRDMEDPVARNAAGVALFGTQWEDLGDAILGLDVTTAVDKLGQVEGAAKSALDTLGDNSAGKIESAKRNIELAADGIKGALATAFSPQIEGFATFVTTNREAVMTFLLDAANGALDFGRMLVEAAASGTEAVGGFLSGPCADLIDALADIVLGIDAATPGDQQGQAFRDWADDAIAGLEETDKSLGDVADTMRTNLIENGIDPAQQKLNELAIPMVAEAALNDATGRLAAGIEQVGYKADGSKLSLEGLDLQNLTTSDSGKLLDEQIQAVVSSLDEQVVSAVGAGESQDDLRGRVASARQAFIDQMTAMGLTEQQAADLADQYGLIPEKVDTVVTADTDPAKTNASGLITYLNTLRATVGVTAETTQAQMDLNAFINRNSGRRIFVGTTSVTAQAAGSVLEFFADGAENHVAQIAPAGSMRVWAEPETGGEAYIPLAQSKRDRSMSILQEVADRFGADLVPRSFADGGVVGTRTGSSGAEPARVTKVYPTTLVSRERVTARDIRDAMTVHDMLSL